MRLDIMVDTETLGHATNSTIIQLAAIAFNIETGEQYSEFNQVVDIEKNEVNHITGSTLKWWLNTNKDLLHQLISTGNYSSGEVLLNFKKWIIEQYTSRNLSHTDVFLWGNGILFDNKMIQHQLETIGETYPIFFRNDRDVRTLVELASKKTNQTERDLKKSFQDSNLVAHNALDDVKYQINLAVGCFSLLTK